MTLRFATYNIRNGDADDGPNSWPYRKEALLATLRQLDADVLGLQEVLRDQLQFILSEMPDYTSIGVGRLDGREEGEFAPILYRGDRLTADETGWFWLSTTPDVPGSKAWDTACERLCTWCHLRTNGGSALVFNTHLDHVSPEARLNGMRLILSRSQDGPAVIMGDFNAEPNEAPIQALQAAGFLDSGAAIDGSTFHNWTGASGGRIDYIFGREVSMGAAFIVTDQIGGRHASDHFPVAASVKLK